VAPLIPVKPALQSLRNSASVFDLDTAFSLKKFGVEVLGSVKSLRFWAGSVGFPL